MAERKITYNTVGDGWLCTDTGGYGFVFVLTDKRGENPILSYVYKHKTTNLHADIATFELDGKTYYLGEYRTGNELFYIDFHSDLVLLPDCYLNANGLGQMTYTKGQTRLSK